jgi:hypothetical protein
MPIQSAQALLKPHYCQAGIAHHESGHGVVSCTLENGLGCSGLSIWRNHDAPYDSWSGITTGLEFRTGEGLTPETAWLEILVFAAGPCASRHFEGLPLSPADIWGDDSAYSDAPNARMLAEHFWPAQADDVLEVGAAHAAALVTRPDVWAAIKAVADYVSVRRSASVTEAEILIRRHVPQPIPAPGLEWALGLIG